MSKAQELFIKGELDKSPPNVHPSWQRDNKLENVNQE